MYIYENGEQLLLQTFDGVLHKVDIIHNDSHHFVEGEKDELIFWFTNGDREFGITNKDATLIDYDFIDRVIRSICVDTKRRRDLYHRQISRQIPANLKPEEYNKFLPAWNGFRTLNCNMFLWKLKNRTIYRQPSMLEESVDREKAKGFLFHLRNYKRELNENESSLRKEFGLKFVYPEELFYKTHKIT